MGPHTLRRMSWRASTILALLLVTPAAGAATIRLEDGATVTGEVLRTDDEDVIVRVRRESIRTIDGVSLPRPLSVGMAAPAFTVTDTLGDPYTVNASTNKTTVLHFWISWCPFCQTDAPQIQALYDRFHDKTDVRVLSVSLDEDRGKLEQYMKDRKVTYPVILAKDPSAPPGRPDLGALYQISGFPVTYVIDAKGVIRKKVVGSFVKTHVDLGAFLDQLLAASHAPSSPPAS